MPLIGLSAGRTVLSTDASMIVSIAATEILIQAHPSNTVLVLLGTSTAQTIHLSAAVAVTIPVSHGNFIYGKTSSGSASVQWAVNSRWF